MADNYLSDKESHNPSEKPRMPMHKVLQRYIPIVAINVVVILILAFFISPWSKVGVVSVEGNEMVYVQEILNESGIHSGDPLIETLQDSDLIADQITNELPQISDTTVERVGINDLKIQVEEYGTVAYIAQEGSYLRVLENGTVLDDAFNISIGNQPVLSNFEEGEPLNLMIEELSHLDLPILNLISEIELVENRSNPLFIRVFMNNGNRVLSSIQTFSEKIIYYPQMVQAVDGEKGVFDMEVGVYFTPFLQQQDIDMDTEVDETARQELEDFPG